MSSNSSRPFTSMRGLVPVILIAITFLGLLQFQKAFAYGGLEVVVLRMLPIAVLAWVLFARKSWWLIVPVSYTFGGIIQLTFRLFFHELSLVLAFLALIPAVLMNPGMFQRRRRLPLPFYLLLAYFLFHAIANALWLKHFAFGAIGSVLRVYMHGLWPMVFLLLFHFFASTAKLPAALITMYAAGVLRLGLGALSLVFPGSAFAGFLNVLLPAATAGASDLRTVAIPLETLSLAFAQSARTRPRRIACYLMAAAAVFSLFFGGGRISLGIGFVTAVTWAVVTRRSAMAAAGIVIVGCALLWLNAEPDYIYKLPSTVRRALSVAVVDSQFTDIHRSVELSNIWHKELIRLGMARWSESPVAMLLGRMVKPYAEHYDVPHTSLEGRAFIAAEMGSYESGLWTVLGVLGLVGAALYAATFIAFLRRALLPLLRNELDGYRFVIAFAAFSSSLSWALFSWIAGHFPSYQLMLCGMAMIAIEDGLPSRTERATAGAQTE